MASFLFIDKVEGGEWRREHGKGGSGEEDEG